jgi:hypothetical protein
MQAIIGRKGLNRLAASGSNGRCAADRWIKEGNTPLGGRGYSAMPSGTARCGSSCSCPPTASGGRALVAHVLLPEKLAKIDATIARHGRYVMFQLGRGWQWSERLPEDPAPD